MSDLAAALAALQADLPRIKRKARGQVGTRYFKYPEYPEILAVVRPIMAGHGFLWNSRPMLVEIGGAVRFVLHYELTHLPSQTAINGFYPLAEGPPQQQGAAIAYAKRYCLVAVLDLEVEGEDNMDAPTRRPVRSKTTGPEHERVREGLHTSTPDQRPADRGPLPDDENVWQTQLPEESGTETRAGSVDPKDRARIMMLCQGMTRDARLARVSALAGRDVDSVNDLSFIEGKMIRGRLEAEK